MSKETEFDYDADLNINEDALDVEWLEQPRLFLKYSQLLADARRTQDQLKERDEVLRAEIATGVRANPTEYGIDKVTVDAVNNAVAQDSRVNQSAQALREAAYEVDMFKAAVSAFEHRKAALENLVRLAGQNYFATPAVPRNLHEERERLHKLGRATATERVLSARSSRRAGRTREG